MEQAGAASSPIRLLMRRRLDMRDDVHGVKTLVPGRLLGRFLGRRFLRGFSGTGQYNRMPVSSMVSPDPRQLTVKFYFYFNVFPETVSGFDC